jgi:hypothetical protein
MKNKIGITLLSIGFIFGCSNPNDDQNTIYTGEIIVTGNTVYLTDCETGVKYEVKGDVTELIAGAKDRITEGENQVFVQIQADTIDSYTLQLQSVDAYLDQPPASCNYHMGYLSTMAKTNWTITADDKPLSLQMNQDEWVLTLDGEEILYPPVNVRITNKFLEYDSSTLWNDNQSFIRIAIMPRACEGETDGGYYAVITLDNELIKACASK